MTQEILDKIPAGAVVLAEVPEKDYVRVRIRYKADGRQETVLVRPAWVAPRPLSDRHPPPWDE